MVLYNFGSLPAGARKAPGEQSEALETPRPKRSRAQQPESSGKRLQRSRSLVVTEEEKEGVSSQDGFNIDAFVAWESSSPVSSKQLECESTTRSAKHSSRSSSAEDSVVVDPATELMDRFHSIPSSPTSTFPVYQPRPSSSRRKLRRVESDVLNLRTPVKAEKDRSRARLQHLYSPGYINRSLSIKDGTASSAASGSINEASSLRIALSKVPQPKLEIKDLEIEALESPKLLSGTPQPGITLSLTASDAKLIAEQKASLPSDTPTRATPPVLANGALIEAKETTKDEFGSDDIDIDWEEIDRLENSKSSATPSVPLLDTASQSKSVKQHESVLPVPILTKSAPPAEVPTVQPLPLTVKQPLETRPDFSSLFEDLLDVDDDLDLVPTTKELNAVSNPTDVVSVEVDLDDFADLDTAIVGSSAIGDITSVKATRSRAEDPEPVLLTTTLRNQNVQRYVVTAIQDSEYSDGSNRVKNQLHLKTTHQTGPKSLLLRGLWLDTPVEIGAILHVIGSCDSTSDEPIVIDNANNLVVLYPDILVSATNIADSLTCPRRVILRERIRSAGESSVYLVMGSMIHNLFQICLLNSDFSTEYCKTQIERMINDDYLEEIALVGMTIAETQSKLEEVVPDLQQWQGKFLRQKPLPYNKVPEYRNSNGAGNLVSISKIVDIEEELWSPMYGLKGKVDVTVEASIMTTTSSGKYLVPLELKTSRSSQTIQHRAQTTLYTLLLSDRYDIEIFSGFLYYSNQREMIHVPAFHDEIRDLMCARNRLAIHMKSTQSLPPVMRDNYECGRCYRNTDCMIYHKAEGGDEESSGVSIFPAFTGHLSDADMEFFKHWDSLLAKESLDAARYLREIWTMTSQQRESAGRCIGQLSLKALAEEWKSSSAEGNRYTYILERADVDGSTAPISAESQLISGDFIVVSDESGHVCLARGTFRYANNREVKIVVDRRLDAALSRLPGFNSANNQLFTSRIGRDVAADASKKLFRIDRDEFAQAMAIARTSLVRLFAAETRQRLRDLIVGFAPPRYMHASPSFDSDMMSRMNLDQQAAVHKVLRAEDYALILGMPGTGKTTTITTIIRVLISLGKTVLISSHTHSAVDNIMMKLKDSGVESMLRIGTLSRVHRDVQSFSPRSKTVGCKEDVEKVYYSPSIVGCTALGLGHWLFTKRRFDYCIVDEASQLTLPACLGPINLADKFVLVGDHYQLSPVVRNAEAMNGGLDVSLFRRLCEGCPDSVTNLEHQYRMSNDIMTLSNELIYNGQLKSGSTIVGEQRLKIPHPEGLEKWKSAGINLKNDWLQDIFDEKRSVLFLNTDNIPALETSKGEGVQNTTEAVIVSHLVGALVECGVPDKSIGVISVYRAQLRLLAKYVGGHKGLEVLTGDKSQGRDKDCIIVSLVRSNDRGQVGDLLKDWRRLNVCFTRAKSKLVIVGSRKTLLSSVVPKAFVDLIDRHGWMYDLPPGCTELYSVPPKAVSSAESPRRVGKRTFTAGPKVVAMKPLLRDALKEMDVNQLGQ